MRKLDRLVWTAGMSFVAEGVRIGVRVNDPSLLPEIAARLPVGARPLPARRVEYLYSIVAPRPGARAGVRPFHLMYVDSARVVRTTERSELLAGVERYFEETMMVGAPRRVFLHAGVVGWRGRAILLPGVSHSGKSTLVSELVRAGATYYSDEYALLDRQGRVHPYARKLRLRLDGDADVRDVPPEELGKIGRRPLPVALVALLRYREDARWRPRAVKPARAVLDLLMNAPTARVNPSSVLAALQPLARGARVVAGVRGEAREVVPELLRAATG